MRIALFTVGVLTSIIGVVTAIQYSITIGMTLIIIGTLIEIGALILKRKKTEVS